MALNQVLRSSGRVHEADKAAGPAVGSVPGVSGGVGEEDRMEAARALFAALPPPPFPLKLPVSSSVSASGR